TMARISTIVWISLAFFGVAFVASVTHVVLHGRRTLRAMRSLSAGAQEGMAALDAGSAEMERRAASLEEKSERLAAATERLRESRAQLAVLQAASGDVRLEVTALRRLMPRK